MGKKFYIQKFLGVISALQLFSWLFLGGTELNTFLICFLGFLQCIYKQNWQTAGALSSHTNDTAENVSPTCPSIWDAIIIAHTLTILLPLCSPALGL